MGGGQPSAFEPVFFGLQALGALLWVGALIALAVVRPSPRWIFPALGLQFALCVLAPLVWLIGFPSQSGIDGAGRVLVGGPATLINGLLGAAFGLLAGRKTSATWRPGVPFVAALGAAVAIWVVFLFS